jgi:glycosyltransferase involved in cell wall biosynthesis
MAGPRLTVVIPVYNEERILPSALADLTAGLDARRLDYEVLFAENGSTDGTPALLEQLTTREPPAPLVPLQRAQLRSRAEAGDARSAGRAGVLRRDRPL